MPITASCLIIYLDRQDDRVPLDGLLMELAAEGDPGERREVAPAEIAGSAAVRRRRDIPAPPSAVTAPGAAARPLSSAVTIVPPARKLSPADPGWTASGP